MNTHSLSSRGGKPPVNVSNGERAVSLLSGAFLLLKGLRQRNTLAGLTLIATGGGLLFRGLSGHCVGYHWLNNADVDGGHRRVVHRRIKLDRSPTEVYAFWRNPENLAQLSPSIDDVKALDEKRSFWRLKGPSGLHLEWTAEIIEDHPGEIIAWRSLPDTPLDNAGTVRFQPAEGGGTDVHVQIAYRFTAPLLQKVAGRAAEKALDYQVDHALRQMRSLISRPVEV